MGRVLRVKRDSSPADPTEDAARRGADTRAPDSSPETPISEEQLNRFICEIRVRLPLMVYEVVLEVMAKWMEAATESGGNLKKAPCLKDLARAADELIAKELGDPTTVGRRTAESALAEAMQGPLGIKKNGERISGDEEVPLAELEKLVRTGLDKLIRTLPPRYRDEARGMTEERIGRSQAD